MTTQRIARDDEYSSFVARKLSYRETSGVNPELLDASNLAPHQEALTRWALRKGKAAIFANTGLGKTRMQLKWADTVHRATGSDVLVLAPLAVAEQTREEGMRIGLSVTHARNASDIRPGITITNYDRLHRFDPSLFGAVVLDESSRIKHDDSKTLGMLMDAFGDTPFKLCATATPAPNDWTELGTHAQFLGVCTVSEMLAEFFVHDGGETQVWRLKGHAREAFWRWVASWGAMIQSPADLGFDASAYELPPLNVRQVNVQSDAQAADGTLFAMEAQTLSERRQAKRDSLVYRMRECANIVFSHWSKLANCDKLAASQSIGGAHGLEERVCGEQKEKSGFGPGIQGKTECAEHERQGGEERLHARILQGEPGEIRKADSRAERQAQRGEEKEIRRGQGIQRGAQGERQGLAGEQPRETQESKADVCARAGDRGFSGDARDTKRQMRDLRAFGHVESKDIPDGRPLPQDRSNQGIALHELQPGFGEVQGQREQPSICDSVPLTPYLIWCELNDEQDTLEKIFGDYAFSVRGSDKPEVKEDAIIRWLRKERPIMISKAKIMGWGLNLQHCNHMIFVSPTDSFESYYQSVRRCWRFGQPNPVYVSILASDYEGAVLRNLQRKESDAIEMFRSLSRETASAVRDEVMGQKRQYNTYSPDKAMALPSFMSSHVRSIAA